MNEQALWSRRIRPWLQKLERAGAPIWWAKNHGSAYSRDRIDVECHIAGIFVAIELKNPDNPKAPTDGQLRELRRLEKSGATCMVSHDEREVKQLISEVLYNRDWTDPKLTEPWIRTNEI